MNLHTTGDPISKFAVPEDPISGDSISKDTIYGDSISGSKISGESCHRSRIYAYSSSANAISGTSTSGNSIVEREGGKREGDGVSIPSYTSIDLHMRHVFSYTSKYPPISSSTTTYLKISNLRNMRADMKSKYRHIFGPRAFPKTRI